MIIEDMHKQFMDDSKETFPSPVPSGPLILSTEEKKVKV